MRSIKSYFRPLAALALVLVFAGLASAQVVSTPPSNVTLSISVTESITVTATPSGVSLLKSGSNYTNATTPISVTVNWNLQPSRSTLNVCQSLILGTLPGTLSNYTSSVNGGAPGVFSSSGGSSTTCNSFFTAIGPDTFDTALTPANVANGTHTDNVVIATTGIGALPTGTYQGQVSFVAIAQ